MSNGRIGSRARRSTTENSARSAAATTKAPDDLCAPPRMLLAAPHEAEQERADTAGEQPGAEPVDRVIGQRGPARHRDRDHDQREPADGQVDQEDPAPAGVVDDEPADGRPDDRRGGEDRSDQSLPLATVARRDDVPDHRQGEREEPARPDSLDGAKDDQLRSSTSTRRREPSRRGRRRSRRGRGSCARRRRRAFRTSGTVTVEVSM